MFTKINLKTLSIIFGVLLVVVLIVFLVGNESDYQSFKSELTQIDIAQINELIIHPRSGREPVKFRKENENWIVSSGTEDYNADNQQVDNMLNSISNLKAKRLAAKSDKNWEKYEVTDSLATQVEVKEKNGKITHLYIGKFSYTQAPQSNNPYQQNQGIMTSFVRLAGEDDVYAVDGFLKMSFDKDLKNFRDQKLTDLLKNDIATVKVEQAGGGFSLNKKDQLWMLDGVQADSTAAANYVSKLNHLKSRNFLTEEQFENQIPTHQLQIFGQDGKELVKIDALYSDSTHIAIRSSINPGTIFDGAQSDLFKKLFVNKESLR